MPIKDSEQRRAWERDYLKKKRKEHPEYFLWKAAKRRAKVKGLDFDIEVSDIIIPEFCPFLNIPLIVTVGEGCRTDNSPSLDRINNSSGYIKGNIIVCSWRANFLKSDAGLEELSLLLTNWQSLRSNL